MFPTLEPDRELHFGVRYPCIAIHINDNPNPQLVSITSELLVLMVEKGIGSEEVKEAVSKRVQEELINPLIESVRSRAYDYRKARGILADVADEPAEDSIRRLRGDI